MLLVVVVNVLYVGFQVQSSAVGTSELCAGVKCVAPLNNHVVSTCNQVPLVLLIHARLS